MEAFIREARLVTLSFFVPDNALKKHSARLIDSRVGLTKHQFAASASDHEVRARIIDRYFDIGMKYFQRYALTNLVIFMDESSQTRFNYLSEEINTVNERINEIRENMKFGQATFAELGEYLMIQIQLTSIRDAIERNMINALEGAGFREHVLPDIAKIFYEDNKKRQKQQPLVIKS